MVVRVEINNYFSSFFFFLLTYRKHENKRLYYLANVLFHILFLNEYTLNSIDFTIA